MCTVHCGLYSEYSTLWSVQCVHCTVQSVYRTVVCTVCVQTLGKQEAKSCHTSSGPFTATGVGNIHANIDSLYIVCIHSI